MSKVFKISVIILSMIILSSLRGFSQLEFSNWLIGTHTVINIDLEGNIKKIQVSEPTKGNGTLCLSNYKSEIIIYGDINDIKTYNNIHYGGDMRSHFKTYAFKSPDNQYIYQLISFYQNSTYYNEIQTETYCYIIENTDNPQIIKEVTITTNKETLYSHWIDCAIPHSDGKSMWLIIQNKTNELQSYILEGENIKLAHTTTTNKIKTDYSTTPSIVIPETGKIYYSEVTTNHIQYISVNQSTGEISEPEDLNITSKFFEITASGKYLYTEGQNEISRYNLPKLESGIIEQETISSTYNNRNNMRIGIDGNIYILTENSLNIIRNPESEEPIYKENIIEIPDIIKNRHNPIQNYLRSYTTFSDKTCNQNSQFTYMGQKAESILWDFGDGASSTEPSPEHAYAAPGKYTVEMTARFHNGDTKTVSKEIEVSGTHKPIIKWR